MFFSSVHADDDLKRYPAAIQKAIEYAKNTDFSALEDGRQEIDGDKMYANLFHLTSKQKEEAHPELHKKYVDVQYWICGEELCGVAPYNGVGKCIETREDDDLYLYVLHPRDGGLLRRVLSQRRASPRRVRGRQAARLPQGGRQGER